MAQITVWKTVLQELEGLAEELIPEVVNFIRIAILSLILPGGRTWTGDRLRPHAGARVTPGPSQTQRAGRQLGRCEG
jgi:hypothetical protein